MRHNFDSVNVSTIIFNRQGQVLLGKRSMDEDVYPGLWGIPGGKIDVTEFENGIVEHNLYREVKEEMGITIKIVDYLSSNSLEAEGQAKLYLIFISEYISGTPQALEDTVEVRWFDPKELTPAMLTPKTYHNIIDASKHNKV